MEKEQATNLYDLTGQESGIVVYHPDGWCQKVDGKKPVGRPPMAPDIKRKVRTIKMSDKEWQELERRAKEMGVSIAEYIRVKALAGD